MKVMAKKYYEGFLVKSEVLSEHELQITTVQYEIQNSGITEGLRTVEEEKGGYKQSVKSPCTCE